MAFNFFGTLVAVVVISTVSCAHAAEDFGTCTTPKGDTGLCINVRKCASVVSLLRQKPLSPEIVAHLQESQCGYKDKTVLVCCPDHKAELVRPGKLALLPKDNECGDITFDRIFRGSSTNIDQFNWMALLEYSKGENATDHHCGGILINDRYILTAAHCVTGLPKDWSLTSVRLGEWDTSSSPDCDELSGEKDCADAHVDVPIEKVIPHEKFVPTPTNRHHDIALVRLSSKVNYTDFVQPICMPAETDSEIDAAEENLHLVGWGATASGVSINKKQQNTAPVVPLNKCQAKPDLELSTSQLCVESAAQNEPCVIDSGGPAINFRRKHPGFGKMFVVGIQSFTIGDCSLNGSRSVFTKVRDYADWILENIEP